MIYLHVIPHIDFWNIFCTDKITWSSTWVAARIIHLMGMEKKRLASPMMVPVVNDRRGVSSFSSDKTSITPEATHNIISLIPNGWRIMSPGKNDIFLIMSETLIKINKQVTGTEC